MEMKKKAWSRPEVSVVQFAAGDYCVSTCIDVQTYTIECNLQGYRVLFDNGDGIFQHDINSGYGKGSYTVMHSSNNSAAEFISKFTNNQYEYDQRYWQIGTRPSELDIQNDQFYHLDGSGNHTISFTDSFEQFNGWYYGGTNVEDTKPAYIFYDAKNEVIHASSGPAVMDFSRNRS